MSGAESTRPLFSEEEIRTFAAELYGIDASVQRLYSYFDQNFHLRDGSGREFVFKVANQAEKREVLDAQNRAMEHLATHGKSVECPRVCETVSGEEIAYVTGGSGAKHMARMLTFLEGTFLADSGGHTPELLYGFGRFLGAVDRGLEGFHHPGANRYLPWDLTNALHAGRNIGYIGDPRRRSFVEYFLLQFETFVAPVLPHLSSSVIHNDANDYNVLTRESGSGGSHVVGIIDFGDMIFTYTIFELAVALAYIMLDKGDPVTEATHVVRGYSEVVPLAEPELDMLFYLVCARLCVSVTSSARQKTLDPDNDYITVSEKPAWELLERLIEVNPELARKEFGRACGISFSPDQYGMSHERIIDLRGLHIGKSLSISYRKPLKIIRGAMQYLYDDTGRTYLDAVNNVPHVGHCHPRVVRAARRQTALLNTNTRYLHEDLVKYAGCLARLLPGPLNVCFLVCTGSEANDLAIRMARTHTGQKDIIVVDGAYHGTTTTDIEISPYKFDGPGGSGAVPYIHKVAMPDTYRGMHKSEDSEAGRKYAEYVLDAIRHVQKNKRSVAAFICEPLMGCGGQIVFPENYLREAFRHVRNAGGVCIADEVQIGFGRVGTHFWGFETQEVIPDIVTLGKPIGNGHPLAAVVTTEEIADSFNTGMEYFNTFGGNPVSCAVGLAVLDVIEEEELQENALRVGARLKRGLEQLMEKHPLIGDVRGKGLFIGIELVLDRGTLAPAAEQALYIIERMKDEGILISVDGPLRNVLKIKPPMVFTEANADSLVSTLDKVLDEDALEKL